MIVLGGGGVCVYWWPSARFLNNHVFIAQKIIWFPNRQLRYEPHQYQSTLLNNLFSYLTVIYHQIPGVANITQEW